jgi:RHS repeat-associated protein
VLRRSINGGATTITTYPFGAEEHTYSGTGTLQSNTYYYSLGGRLIGELTGSPTPLNTSIFLTDALGSVLATFSNTAGSAALLGNQVYGPYGTQRYTKGAMGTNKGFTGQYNDTLTGLDYYNARYYDPTAAVFLSADTVQGNISGMNPYDYVGGNPETHNDPTGHDGDPGLTQQLVNNPWVLIAAAIAIDPAGAAAWFLIGTSIAITEAPSGQQGGYPSNGPQPTAAPTPDETPTPEPTPSTDTNGAMCRPGGCYNLVGDEGKSVFWYNQQQGRIFQSTAHTIAEHVTISDSALRRSTKRSDSKFYSLDAAEWATQYALDHMTPTQYAEIYGLSGNPANAGQRRDITVNTGVEIGYGYRRANPTRITTTWVTTVVAIDNNGNPFVLTSYPQLNPPPTAPPLSALQIHLININSN